MTSAFKRRDLPAAGGYPASELWEFKTFNRHSAIIRVDGAGGRRLDPFDPEGYLAATRRRILEETRPNLFRGLAFGSILELPEVPAGLERLADGIDVRQRERSVWQWMIVACARERVALGVHTWMQVFLTPLYRGWLGQYRGEGYAVEDFKAEKDKILQFLERAAPGVLPQDYRPRGSREPGGSGG